MNITTENVGGVSVRRVVRARTDRKQLLNTTRENERILRRAWE